MTRQRAYALLGAMVALVALVCTAIVGGFDLLGGAARAGGGHGNGTGTGDGTGIGLGQGQGLSTGSGSGSDSDSGSGSHHANGTGSGTGGDAWSSRPPGRTPVGNADPASAESWSGTWAAAPGGAEPGAPIGHPGRSIRNVIHTSIGGTGVRVTLSNLYSPTALLIGHASVAIGTGGGQRGTDGGGDGRGDGRGEGGGGGGSGAEAVAGTMRKLTFGRQSAVTVPPRGQIVSDPVELPVPYDGDLLITLYTPAPGGPVTYHPQAYQTSYLAQGDRTEDLDGTAYTQPTPFWRYVTAVDVLNRESPGAVVAFGDSITDGDGSLHDANRRWPDVLAARLRDRHIGVLNAGVSGNRVLGDESRRGCGASGLSRFRHDVLGRTGVRAVVIDLGVNDILRGGERDPRRITAGLRELTRQAHARGVRVIGATLAPFGGHRGYSAATESVRQRVNEEIRSGGIFDEVVDFDQVLRDPYAPDRLRPVYDSGDGLHPSDAGYRAMGRHLDLESLEGKVPAQL
ncbi:SGNH/GDSL hydrolase family protein [Streptomyces sp. NPDC002018]|uniref:SGNH/GDSL hydrolase family protein n=1 Tax=Streptomyces sp. NPDC002018 TaxID=3364629 RepID=UPI0036ADC9FA